MIWLADGLFLLGVPPADADTGAADLGDARGGGWADWPGAVSRALDRGGGADCAPQRRERVLHDFLELSNRLRVTSEPQMVLEEVALAVQASGKFDCVTLSRVNWRAGTATVAVAIGASGRRLEAIEGLQFRLG